MIRVKKGKRKGHRKDFHRGRETHMQKRLEREFECTSRRRK